MKVVLMPSSVDPVGVATHVLNLARLLARHGMLDVVLCPRRGWLTERLGRERLPCAVLPFSHRPASVVPSSVRLLRFLRRRRSADTVHVHGRLPLILSLLPMLACPRVRFVATVHEFSGTRADGPWSVKHRLETWLLRRLARICSVSAALQEEIVRRIGEQFREHVEHIPGWIQPSDFVGPEVDPKAVRLDSRSQGRPIRLCGVGRLSHEKGFDLLVEAVAILFRQGYAVACDIYGEGPEAEALAERIVRHDLCGRVVLKGASDDVRTVLPDYDVVVIPSRREAFGLVALEAYDARVPVVASDVPGLKEVVIGDRTGLLFAANDPAALAAAVLRLVTSDALAGALVREGLAFLQDHVPSDGLAARYRWFYRVTCGGIASSASQPL